MHTWMYGWMHGWIDRWTHACIHGWIAGYVDGCMHGWIEGRCIGGWGRPSSQTRPHASWCFKAAKPKSRYENKGTKYFLGGWKSRPNKSLRMVKLIEIGNPCIFDLGLELPFNPCLSRGWQALFLWFLPMCPPWHNAPWVGVCFLPPRKPK